MLVLGRRYGEGLLLELENGESIRIFIEHRGNTTSRQKVRALIDAPKSVRVLRLDSKGEIERPLKGRASR